MVKKYKTSCAIVINDKGQVILIKRGRKPFKGLWGLISGIGESKKGFEPEIGIIEEVNCDLQTESFKGKRLFSALVRNDKYTDEIVVFEGKVNENEIKVRPPFSVDYKWVSEKDMDSLGKLAFEHKKILEKYFRLLGLKST
ncbi:NUDIX hydrolase [Patescibacteria group bacterium]